MSRPKALASTIEDYVTGLVHPSARLDPVTLARHRDFIAARLGGGLAVLLVLPVYLAVLGAPGSLQTTAIAWLLAPIAIAYFLSRTGMFEAAHALSALALVGVITLVAGVTGGLTSFAVVWLAVVPLEAALSGSRRVLGFAVLSVIGSAAALYTISGFHAPFAAPWGDPAAAAMFGVTTAALYGGALAFGFDRVQRTSERLRGIGDARWSLVAAHMTDMVTRHGRNGAVLFASPAAERLTGVTARDLTGHGLFERVHVADRPAYLSALADAASGHAESSVAFRLRQSTPAGGADGHIWVELRARRLVDPNLPGLDEVVAVTRDITATKRYEEELQHARNESEKADAAKGRFLATVSHELRTPLNAIIGFSELLMHERMMQADEKRRLEYAQLIHQSGHHLLSVVNGILDVSKMESGTFEIVTEPCRLDEVVRHCLDLMALKAKAGGVDLVGRLSPALPEIVADKRALTQIMINLISNAVKFTGSGGKVTVFAERVASDVRIVVEDTGIGIAAEDLPRLGNPFFQGRSTYDRPYEGTGLGLSVVKGLIDLHGGRFAIASRVGEGTRVEVRLPLDAEGRARPDNNVTPIAIGRAVPAPMDQQVKRSA